MEVIEAILSVWSVYDRSRKKTVINMRHNVKDGH